jgi:hypothetical protein
MKIGNENGILSSFHLLCGRNTSLNLLMLQLYTPQKFTPHLARLLNKLTNPQIPTIDRFTIHYSDDVSYPNSLCTYNHECPLQYSKAFNSEGCQSCILKSTFRISNPLPPIFHQLSATSGQYRENKYLLNFLNQTRQAERPIASFHSRPCYESLHFHCSN